MMSFTWYHVVQVMEDAIRLNNAVNIHQEYFKDEEEVKEIQESPSEYSVSHHQCLQVWLT